MNATLPQSGLVRLSTIIGNKAKGIPPLYPISRAAWYRGVREGRYPAPVRIGERAVAWRAEDINRLIASLS